MLDSTGDIARAEYTRSVPTQALGSRASCVGTEHLEFMVASGSFIFQPFEFEKKIEKSKK
jgi:hypothetical protein